MNRADIVLRSFCEMLGTGELKRAASRVPADTVGKVYFVECGPGGPVKVGRTRDVRARLASLQTAHHEDLRLLLVLPGGEELERAAHELFAPWRLRGEWFSREGLVRTFLAEQGVPS